MAGIFEKINRFLKPGSSTIAIFHEFHKPPYGGGNQFLLGLEKELKRRGLNVDRNEVRQDTKAVLFNSYNFDFEKLRKAKSASQAMLVHRVDGPIGVYRGEDTGIDKKIWQMNHELADKTIFQSQYSLNKHRELGLEFKNATVIKNAVDPEIFNNHGRTERQGKVKLITTSWSDNPRKGGPILAWLDKHLDFTKYELTFVGRTRSEFVNARIIEALPSQELAEVLKRHDIYIAPSQDDPCSNALIEALACGLPAVYLRSGGHPELVNEAGIAFTDSEDLIPAIEKVAGNYEYYQSRIEVMSLSEAADKYLRVFEI